MGSQVSDRTEQLHFHFHLIAKKYYKISIEFNLDFTLKTIGYLLSKYLQFKVTLMFAHKMFLCGGDGGATLIQKV